MLHSSKHSAAVEIKQRAESDFGFYAKLVCPDLCFGAIHDELFRWMTSPERDLASLVLLPRGHLKSTVAAIWTSWRITIDPKVRILYVSATSALAEAQLYSVGQILTSRVYKRYWPNMVDDNKVKRARWNTSEIIVDHPSRHSTLIRDNTLTAVGVGGNITGKHCDILVLDDLVVPDNVTTPDQRNKIASAYSQLASIKDPGAITLAVGTRYHPDDLYNDLLGLQVYNHETKDSKKMYELFQRQVEDAGDGTGDFIWPRKQAANGAWYGFDSEILAYKKAEYLDKNQFFCQYYNKPNNEATTLIQPEWFQYYDKSYLKHKEGLWTVGGAPLNVTAGVDFAFSLKKKADFSAIVVVGMDSDRKVYVLDVCRFKTDRVSGYFAEIERLYSKWGFKRIRMEAVAAQKQIVNELRYQYFPNNGIVCSIEEHVPNRNSGTKEERIQATLKPRYEQGLVYHYKGGNCELLEEELRFENPPHDDIKDSLTIAVLAAKPASRFVQSTEGSDNIIYHKRFGGVAYR